MNTQLLSLLTACFIGAQPALAHGPAGHGSHAAQTAAEHKAWGVAGVRDKVSRSIEIRMSDDMRFSPDRIDIKRGETILFRIRNTGAVMHEMVIGTRQELEAHAKLMSKHPNMVHDEPYMAHIEPGSSGEIVWHFDRAGQFEFACLIAGHYSAGMRGSILVADHANASTGRSTAPLPHSTHLHTPATTASGETRTNAPASEWVDGEVRRIQLDPPKITIRHSEIKSLDMPAMTMVFSVRERSVLDKVTQGDRVRFRTESASGTFYVTEIETFR